jgi:hypothetical protein
MDGAWVERVGMGEDDIEFSADGMLGMVSKGLLRRPPLRLSKKVPPVGGVVEVGRSRLASGAEPIVLCMSAAAS